MLKAKSLIKSRLADLYSTGEIESFTRLILQRVLGLTGVQLLLIKDEQIPVAKLVEIEQIVTRLAQYEPIQYIFNETEFYGLLFYVNPSVLIPRPETEELVEWILKSAGKRTSLLDIGTGSGCIAVSCAKKGNFHKIGAYDISGEALQIAQKNAMQNQVSIDFSRIDILNWRSYTYKHKWDIIVSNPPYVTYEERKMMESNVLDYEPHLALFVDDDDPLLFYREISLFARENMSRGGNLFFEINEAFGLQTRDLLSELGFIHCELRQDINGKCRMVRATLP